MRPLARLCGLGLVALLIAATPAAADVPPEPQPAPQPQIDEEKLGEQVMGSMLFIFLHELGHALIDELALPTVGPEEDVADEFAIFVMLAAAAEEAQVYQALISAAESWRLMWQEVEPLMRQSPERFPFWDEHNLDIKRFYNIVCLLYGSDPGRFWPVVVSTGVPIDRARKCENEYAQKWQAWERLMQPYLVPEGAAPPAGSGQMKVIYGKPEGQVALGLSELFQREGTWQVIADSIDENIVLPNGIDIFVRSCGVENAWWDPRQRSITLCYDMMEFLARLFVKAALDEQAGGQGQGQQQPQPQPVPVGPNPPGPPPFGPQAPVGQPAPAPAPAPAPVIDHRLVGVWQAQANLQGNATVTRLTLNPDGTFLRIAYGANTQPFYSWGTYALDRERIRFTVAGWQPQQICGQQGCMPVRISQQEYAQFQLMGPGTMQLRESLFYRVQ